MSIKNAVSSLMVNGRKASQVEAREVYNWLLEREKASRGTDSMQGISSAIFGQMNALLRKHGHLEFARDERDAFNAWLGLPPVGSKATTASGKMEDALASLGF